MHPALIRGVDKLGFQHPSPIQSKAIPPALEGRDLLACAVTGSGKTAAFLLPILHQLVDQPRGTTRALVLAPTRELACQIRDDLNALAQFTGLKSVVVHGGVAMGPQKTAFQRGTDVIIATPGRLLDHFQYHYAALSGLEYLVLDEADRMLDMGFWPDVQRIVAALPGSRQTLLFAATTSDDVMRAAALIMRDPKVIRVGRTSGLATAITHVGHVLPSHEKTPWLAGFLRRTNGQTLVFVRTKHWADRLAKRIASGNIRCAALHANRTQSQRTAAIEGFRSGRYQVLVATDIAARGLDIDCIEHIINYEVPTTPDAYVHRVGRTGRAAATGTAVTLVTPEEMPALRVIERSLNLRLTHPPCPARVAS